MKIKIECAFSGVISFGRIWRKVPERDARSVWRWGVGRKSGRGGGGGGGGEISALRWATMRAILIFRLL